MANKAIIQIENMSIPTYPIMESEKMPMFCENRQHQGTKGNPYPVMPVLSVVREGCQPRDYQVIRMENDYIRLILIPELGGRIFEAYDKINDYHFLYRQHVIKPALIGAYGLWISGGLEFNWPFHHRPSTFMPVNFTTETQEDGTVIAWLSECDPTDRTRATVGIVLHPDAAFFETRIQVTNRTPLRHSFLMWQNAAVPVNDDYQFIFPPDVNYAVNHHHANRAPITYPVAKGAYASAYYDTETDISWYKNCFHATSHFSAPSQYDFFGGYDHGKQCGIIHVADHYTSPGKKMFTWGCGELAEQWEHALTDNDGRYCELMASSYSNNQPDFTWLNPYEAKTFSQFWYPVGAIGKTGFATLDAAVNVQNDKGLLKFQTTRSHKKLHVRLNVGGESVLDAVCDSTPCVPITLSFPAIQGEYTVEIATEENVRLLFYRPTKAETLNFPEPVELNPHPDRISTVQDLYLQGLHADQYRNPQIEPDVYYREALRREPGFIPALIGLGEYYLRRGHWAEAKELLEKAVANEHIYNLRYPNGDAEYLLGLTLDAMGQSAAAYECFRNAAWSGNTVAQAMSKAAAIDGRNGKYAAMLKNAVNALEASARHPLAAVYAALAQIGMGDTEKACLRLEEALKLDPLNDLAAFVLCDARGEDLNAFWEHRCSDQSQTALDIAFDLADAGFFDAAQSALSSVKRPSTPMIGYTMAYISELQGKDGSQARMQARQTPISVSFPYRLEELKVLQAALADETDDVARHLLACELYDKGHIERAADLWKEAAKINPKNATYRRCLAVVLFSHLKQKDTALSLLEQAIETEPDRNQLKLEYLYAAEKAGVSGEKRLEVIHAHPWENRPSDDYVLEHARACCLAGKWEDALNVMLKHEFVPAEGGEKAITGLYYSIQLYRSSRLLRNGQIQEALEILMPLSERFPENLHSGLWTETDLTPVYCCQARALKAAGREEESKERYELALKRFSTTLPELTGYYAEAMKALGREIDARKFLSRQIRALNDMETLSSIGWEDMTSSFNTFVNDRQEQRDGMVAYWKGLIYAEEGRLEEAKQLLEKSIRLWPENLNAFIQLKLL